MDKQYRVNLYRTDIKEYKKQKRLEWYDDNKIWKQSESRKKRHENKAKRITPEWKAKRSIINRIYREKVKQK